MREAAKECRPVPGLVKWGNTPAHSTGSLYLPAVRASEVISLADAIYSKHFLIALDAQHDRLPGGQTFEQLRARFSKAEK